MTPTKTVSMTPSSSAESVSQMTPPQPRSTSDSSRVDSLSGFDRLTTAPLFGGYSRTFTPVNFEAASSSTGGLWDLDSDDLSDALRLRSESPSSRPAWGTAFPYTSSTASKRVPTWINPLSTVPRSTFHRTMSSAALSASPAPVPSVPISVISQKMGHSPPTMMSTVASSNPTTHGVPSEVRKTRRRSPEPQPTTDKATKRQRSVPPEHAAEDALAWTLSTWLKNQLISPDRVIAEAMKFQADILEPTPAGTGKADLANAGSAEAMQDIVHSATPDSSERPASMTLGGQGCNVVDIRLTDDMRNVTGPELTTMEDVGPVEPMQKSHSSTLDRPTTPESTLRISPSSIVPGTIPDQDAMVTDSGAPLSEFPPRSPPVQVKQEPQDDLPVPDPPEVGDRLGDFVVVQDGDRMIISLDEGDAFASGDESDDSEVVAPRKRRANLSKWAHGLDETDPALEERLFGPTKGNKARAVPEEEEEEEDDELLKDDTYGIHATDDSALSASELLRKKLYDSMTPSQNADFQTQSRVDGCSIRAPGDARSMGRTLSASTQRWNHPGPVAEAGSIFPSLVQHKIWLCVIGR